MPFGQDGNYSHEAIVNRINADLANDLGNLAQRSLTMIGASTSAACCPKPGAFSATDKAILAAADAMIGKAREAMKTQQLHQVLDAVWAVVAETPTAISPARRRGRSPRPIRRGRATVLYVTAEVIRQVAILAQPFMPDSAGQAARSAGRAGRRARTSPSSAAAHRIAAGTHAAGARAGLSRAMSSREAERAQ